MALQDNFKDEAPFVASGVCQVSASSQSIEDLRIRRARLRRVIQSPSAYPAKMRLVSEAHLHMPSQMVSLSNCHVVPYSTEFHRSTTFTSSFTGLYHDSSLSSASMHDQRTRRHAIKQEARIERRRTKCLQMQYLAAKYQTRARDLRQRLREDRQKQYTSLLSAVRRIQAVFRRRQLIRRKKAEEARANQKAALVLCDFGRRVVTIMAAKKELSRRRHVLRCEAAVKAISTWWRKLLAILHARRLRKKIQAERQNRQAQCRLNIALFCQSYFRGRRVRRFVALLRRQEMEREIEAAKLAAALEEERERRQRKRGELHGRPFR